MTIRDNNGYVLITSLLLLLILTVVGMAAISTSTIENLLAGNIRLKEKNDPIADGCGNTSLKIVERIVREGNAQGFENMVPDPALLSAELRTGDHFDGDKAYTSSGTADIECGSGLPRGVVDVDAMFTYFLPGSAIEFASGYEGIGKGAGALGSGTYYRIEASGIGGMNSRSSVGQVYRYVQ